MIGKLSEKGQEEVLKVIVNDLRKNNHDAFQELVDTNSITIKGKTIYINVPTFMNKILTEEAFELSDYDDDSFCN